MPQNMAGCDSVVWYSMFMCNVLLICFRVPCDMKSCRRYHKWHWIDIESWFTFRNKYIVWCAPGAWSTFTWDHVWEARKWKFYRGLKTFKMLQRLDRGIDDNRSLALQCRSMLEHHRAPLGLRCLWVCSVGKWKCHCWTPHFYRVTRKPPSFRIYRYAIY